MAPLVPTGPPIRPVRRSRWRVVFAVVLAAAPLLCLGAIPLAFHSYDTATRPDRSTPDVVVHNYLQAFLVDRDDAAARQFDAGTLDERFAVAVDGSETLALPVGAG